MKKDRRSPTSKTDVKEKNTKAPEEVAPEDISVRLEKEPMEPSQNNQSPIVQNTEESPGPINNAVWKDIYTPRNSHTTEEQEHQEADSSQESDIESVAKKIFLEEEQEPSLEEDHQSISKEEASTPTPASSSSVSGSASKASKQKVVMKEATPRFNVKEKVHQAAVEAKNQKSGASSVPSFMKETRSSHLHVEKKGQKPDLQWEKRLRKNDDDSNLSRKVQSSFRERSSKYSASMLKAMRSDTKTLLPDGRPSLETMTAQWEFMRNQFLGSNNEALEWMMHAKAGGAEAYKHATRKHQIAEDQYFKSLYEIDVLEAKLRIMEGSNSQLSRTLKEIAQCSDMLSLNPGDAEKKAVVQAQQERLKTQYHEELKGVCCQNLQKDIQVIMEASDESKAAKKARHVMNNALPSELKELKERLTKCNQAKEESLVEMEKWDSRVKETDEYDRVQAKKEESWMEEFKEGNLMCLKRMRSLIPKNIAQLSVSDVLKEAKERGALYTHELATEIKNNKLLHWLLMDPADIAMTNFLTGEHRQYFVNLDALDVVELRALRMVLPEKFELDQDGQKAEWRERFIGRLKQLVSQQNEEYVKGGWDADCGKRSMVKLPELKPEQQRRQVYFFRTFDQMTKRLAQYQDKHRLLEKKESLLEKALEEVKSCREEYNCLLEESRDPYFRSEVGLNQLNSAKAEVKADLKAAESKRDYLKADVSRLKKSIQEMPVTLEEFSSLMLEQGAYLNALAASSLPHDDSKDEKPTAYEFETASESVEIVGAFEECPEIKRVERSSAKFQTAEQEAIQRKLELTRVKLSETETGQEPVQGRDSREEAIPRPSQVDKSMFERSSSGVSEEARVPTTPQPRRGSVLLSANKNVIDTLNNIFSPSSLRAGEAPGLAPRRSSIFSPSTNLPVNSRRDSCMSVASDTSAGTVEKKAAKSKTLKKLLERKDSGVEETPKRPVNPLLAAAQKGGGMSFLDQIKAKRAPTSEEEPPQRPSNPLGGGGMSFLDQIKAKRKSDE